MCGRLSSCRAWALALALLGAAPLAPLGCGLQRTRHQATVAAWSDQRLRTGETTTFADSSDRSELAELRLHDYAHREDTLGPLGSSSGVVLNRPQLASLDGQWLSRRPAARILLNPGRHVMQVVNSVRLSGVGSGDYGTLTFSPTRLDLTLEAGVIYDVYAVSGPISRPPIFKPDGSLAAENVVGPVGESDIAEWTSWVWVEDSRSKQPIAGARPPQRP